MKITRRVFKRIADIETNMPLLSNVQEYLAALQYLYNQFGDSDLWYRGVSHVGYELIPKVYRDRLWERHENFEWWLMVDFEHRARRFIPDSHSYSEWEWYFTMQHYGMPTRLLDWTRGSLIALYFAVREPRNTHMPSVYVLNPCWIDEVVNDTEEGLIYNTDTNAVSEEHHELLRSYMYSRSEGPPFPLCVEPPALHDRIHSQKSVFTIHGRYLNPFRVLAKRNKNAQIAKLRIATRQAEHIKQELSEMGITEGTLFPGLDGLVKDLRYYRGID